MEFALHIKTQVLPGNKIEIQTPELTTGETVDVFVVLDKPNSSQRKSVLNILQEIHNKRSFKLTVEEIDQYLQQERDSWER